VPVGVIQVGGSGGSVFVAIGGAGGGIVVGPGLAGSSGRPQITVGPVPPAGSDQVIDLPLNTYADVAEVQQTTLAEASTLLTQQCMAARGFVYTSQASPSQVQTLFQTAEYGFGVTSPADASTYGYGQPKTSASRPGPAFLGGFSTFGDLAKQPRAWVQALLGFAPGARISRVRRPGCGQRVQKFPAQPLKTL